MDLGETNFSNLKTRERKIFLVLLLASYVEAIKEASTQSLDDQLMPQFHKTRGLPYYSLLVQCLCNQKKSFKGFPWKDASVDLRGTRLFAAVRVSTRQTIFNVFLEDFKTKYMTQRRNF